MGGKGRELQKRCAGINQRLYPLTRQHLAPRHMLGPRLLTTPGGNRCRLLTQIGHQIGHGRRIGLKLGIVGIESGA